MPTAPSTAVPGHAPFQFQSLDEVRRQSAGLGLDLHFHPDLSPLFHPRKIGSREVANRLVVLPMEGCDGLADGAPGELTFRRYRRFAAGGAGLLWLEATAVVAEGRANPRQIWLHPGNIPQFAGLVREIHQAARDHHGRAHRPLAIVQLTHSGRYSRPGRQPAPIIAHHSPYLDPGHRLPADYPLISDSELERLEDVYVEAARCAWEAGFDGVDVKACHRYLISELHASHARADSRYGGSFENRTRFFRNIVGKIRSALPGLLVTTRMNACDAMAYPYGFGVDREDATRPDLAEPLDLIRFLAGAGVPLVNITIGNPYYNPYVNRPFDLPAAGGALPPEHPLVGVARFVQIVREIQQAFPTLAVVGGGYSWLRQFFPQLAAANLSRGWASLAGVGRLAFAYPDFARALAERGALDAGRVCVACSACSQIMRDGGRSGCVPRDAEVYEPIYKAGRAEALDTIQAMAKTCRQCADPGCVSRCPARVNVPKFIGQITAGQFREAYETMRQANVLAAVCGYVCPAETLCEAGCINRHYAGPVPIRQLQRWIGRQAVEEGWSAAAAPAATAAPSGRRVAVLGAGPAGLAAAASLAARGHAVTLCDRELEPGGLAWETIPEQRLPNTILRREIQDLLRAHQPSIWLRQVHFSSAADWEQLLGEGFAAVVVALGLRSSVPLPGAKRPASGVLGALDFLAQAKQGWKVRGAVLVLGGGNTAMDAALSARQAGADEVAVVYRRSFAEMPAWPEERDRAIQAGIPFLTLTAPLDYVCAGDGRLAGLRVVRTRLGAPDERGRRTAEPIPGTEHTLPAQWIIEALGQRMEPALAEALPGIRLDARGCIVTQPGSFQTSRPGVFAAGDIVNGGSTVVQAVAEGVQAARETHDYLASARAV